MNPWKVILATLVIFTAGLITGAVGTRQISRATAPPPPTKITLSNPIQHWMLRDEFVQLLSRQLELTPAQKEQIQSIVHESQQRVQILTSLIEPEMREELRHTRETIGAALSPRQKEQYNEILKRRQARRAANVRPSDTAGQNGESSNLPPAQPGSGAK